MRILILSQYFYPEPFPISSLACALRDCGAKVTVLTGQPNYPDGAVYPGYRALSLRGDSMDGIDVFRVPIFPRGRAGGFRLATNYLAFVLSASVLGPLLLRSRPIDVVLVYAPSPILQSIPGIVLKWIKGARVVTWVQDLWPESLESTGFVRNRALLRVATACVRWIYRHNDLLLGQSSAFVSAIKNMANGTPVDYLPNPGERIPTSSATPQLTLPRGFNIVFAGNLGTVQSLDTILDAAELLCDSPDVRFVLIGSGSRSAWLAEEVGRRQLTNVMVAGRFERDAMPAIFEQADALLVTLKRGQILSQTIPSKVQSYLAAGRPVLAALDGEGAALVRDSGAGLASPAEDARALAENVRTLQRLPGPQRDAMGSAGRRYFDSHFDVTVVARRMLDLLSTVAPPGGAPQAEASSV